MKTYTDEIVKSLGHLDATRKEFISFVKRKKIDLKGKRLLDVGCRTSINKPFFEWAYNIYWLGIDKNPEDKNVLKMDMEDLSELNGELNDKYDFVFVCHSLEHCENPLQVLKEFKKVLNNNGWLFISLPCLCKKHLKDDEDHIFILNNMQMKKLLQYVNYKNIECYKGRKGGYSRTNQYNLICIAQKGD